MFNEALENLIASLKPNGHFVTAHMIGSNGYFAGERTSFPAVNVDIEQIENIYHKHANFETYFVNHKHHAGVRKGYTGMSLFMGQKHS